MNIIRAEHLGMCFGVRDAIALATSESKVRPLTIYGDLVHNETVLSTLQSKGIGIRHDLEEIDTPGVMITAHGASERAIQEIKARGFEVLQATCPLVHFAHAAVAELVRDGFHPVIIGKRDHVEVRGMTGDLMEFDVVLTDEDIGQLKERSRFGIAAQTTQPIERVQEIVRAIQRRFPQSQVRFIDTVCRPTKQRQSAAVELAQKCDVVVVIGGAGSNNTRELVNTCRHHCTRVHHVQTKADLRREWFKDDDTIGITAGTSTPDCTIVDVEGWISALAPKAFAKQLERVETYEN